MNVGSGHTRERVSRDGSTSSSFIHTYAREQWYASGTVVRRGSVLASWISNGSIHVPDVDGRTSSLVVHRSVQDGIRRRTTGPLGVVGRLRFDWAGNSSLERKTDSEFRHEYQIRRGPGGKSRIARDSRETIRPEEVDPEEVERFHDPRLVRTFSEPSW